MASGWRRWTAASPSGTVADAKGGAALLLDWLLGRPHEETRRERRSRTVLGRADAQEQVAGAALEQWHHTERELHRQGFGLAWEDLVGPPPPRNGHRRKDTS